MSLLTAALAEQSAVMSITAACSAPVLHRLDIGVGELTRPCDCYASFQETVVPRPICHVHSGAPPAVHPNHTCGVLLMLLPVLDSMPGNRTTPEAVDWMLVPWHCGIVSSKSTPGKACHASHVCLPCIQAARGSLLMHVLICFMRCA